MCNSSYIHAGRQLVATVELSAAARIAEILLIAAIIAAALFWARGRRRRAAALGPIRKIVDVLRIVVAVAPVFAPKKQLEFRLKSFTGQ